MARIGNRFPLLLACAAVIALGGCTSGVTSTPGESTNLEKRAAELGA